MIAYFILVHRYPEQFKRLFKAIYREGNQYLIHIDKSSGKQLSDEIEDFLSSYYGAQILEPKNALWGGYSLVDAEIRGMERLLKMDKDWKYYINLSGQDFPLKSQEYIEDFLNENQGREYIRSLDQKLIRPDTLNRINNIFIEAFSKIFRTGIKRKFLKNARPYIGTQWKVVSREFCDMVVNDPLVNRFKKFYRNSFIADESFFQTIMMNVFKSKNQINDDLRTIDWVPDGDIKLRPRNFGKADFMRLTLSPDLFARKFDTTEDTEILGLLEKHLKTPSANNYIPDLKFKSPRILHAV